MLNEIKGYDVMTARECLVFNGISEEWKGGLIEQGFDVKICFSFTELKEECAKKPVFVIYCTESLNAENIKQIREVYNGIILVCPGSENEYREEDEILALENGADEVLKNGSSFQLLWLRMKNAAKRVTAASENGQSENDIFRVKNLELKYLYGTVRLQGRELLLTGIEYKILECFARHYGQTLSREQIIRRVQGIEFEGFDRTIDSHIKNIRRKISVASNGESYIKTIYGLGYKMIV